MAVYAASASLGECDVKEAVIAHILSTLERSCIGLVSRTTTEEKTASTSNHLRACSPDLLHEGLNDDKFHANTKEWKKKIVDVPPLLETSQISRMSNNLLPSARLVAKILQTKESIGPPRA